MPLFPQVVGGLTVRERPARYSGEPKYRRLDFVRSKSDDSSADSWPIVTSTQPIRGIQLYAPQYGQAYWPGYASQAQRYAAAQQYAAHHQHHAHPAVQGRYPPNHPIHSIPAPALSDGRRPRALKAKGESDSEGDAFVRVITEKKDKKKGKKKGKKAKIASGHAIFESSDSESDYVPIKKSHKKR